MIKVQQIRARLTMDHGYLFILTFLALFLYINTANAQSQAGCDVNVWKAMSQQGIMQARRQDMMNKRYITKSDSVLQYSCFEQDLQNVADTIGPIFSNGSFFANNTTQISVGEPEEGEEEVTSTIEIYNVNSPTEYGGPTESGGLSTDGAGYEYKGLYLPSLLSPTSLEEALLLTITPATVDYINDQFDHFALAGTTDYRAPDRLCMNMSDIWQAAKCKNFDDPIMFYKLEDLANIDPREFPPNMKCGI